MKITIEGTNQNKGHAVNIYTPDDDLTIHDLMECIKQAILGYGYAQGSIDDYFEEGE